MTRSNSREDIQLRIHDVSKGLQERRADEERNQKETDDAGLGCDFVDKQSKSERVDRWIII